MAAGRSRSVLIKIIGSLIPAVLPPLHIAALYYFWGNFARRVDKRYCTCSCWDTVYKGTYESGIASYKHVYFNATWNTTKIWLLTVFGILVLYEAIKYFIKLLLEWKVRLTMFILFLTSVFAHYYSWWVYFNYWNDEFYHQWNHQLFFSTTELLSTILVVDIADKRSNITSKKALAIVGIALIHIISGSWDQFVVNVIWGEGYAHQVVRDIGFMIPDVLHVVLPLVELFRSRKQTSCFQFLNDDFKKDFVCMICLVSLGCTVSYWL